MTRRGRALIVLVAVTAALVAPAAAWAHAVLLHTSPVASKTLATAPTQVALTFSEAGWNLCGEHDTAGRPSAWP